MEQVAVMQNVFYNRKISKIFDLKGSLRGRFAANLHHGHHSVQQHSNNNNKQHLKMDRNENNHTNETFKGRKERDSNDNSNNEKWTNDIDSRHSSSSNSIVDDSVTGSIETSLSRHRNTENGKILPPSIGTSSHSSHLRESYTDPETQISTLLDGDFLEYTSGRPMPLTDRAKAVFQMSILNDTLFLNYIYVLDYSILIGFDEENKELVVGIIDFMRQYDILKQMERVGKSLPMVVGSEAPTIIQPPLYKARFTNAMERYFMTVPSKWTTI
jgi:Phosphatidylinositol-4-phosphate 5-Kinase